VNRKQRVHQMRETAKAIGLTQVVRQIAMSHAPLDDHTTALVARALALLGEPGYSTTESERFGRVW
jgi:hypothetical protein